MVKRILVLTLAIAIAGTTSAPVAFAQSPNDALKIKSAVDKIGVHGDITVVRSDDRWFYGTVEQVDASSFTIYEIEQKQRINFSFDQVKNVYKGYGAGQTLARDIHGHRIPPRRHKIGLIIAGAAAAVLIVVAVALG